MITLDIRPLQDSKRSGVGYYTAHIVEALVRRAQNKYALFSSGLKIQNNASHQSLVTSHHIKIPNKILNTLGATIGQPTIEKLIPETKLTYLPNLNFFASISHILSPSICYSSIFQNFSPKQRAWHAAIRLKIIAQCTYYRGITTTSMISATHIYSSEKISVAMPELMKLFRN